MKRVERPKRWRLPPQLLTWLVISACGCNPSPFELAPVRGKVTIDGQPYPTGKVMFAPVATGDSRIAGKPAFGRVQPDGTFRLTTFEEGDGAVVGPHWVTLICRLADRQQAGAAAKVTTPVLLKNIARIRYPQQMTIVAGNENAVDIALTSQQVRQYGEQAD